MEDENTETRDTATAKVSPLEARVEALEAVVKVLAEHSRAAAHDVVVAWRERTGA